MDKKFMQIAINKAYENLGEAFPNPSVGAVLVKDGLILGKEVSSKNGGPHAEFKLLEKEQAKGATLYVTLEPCTYVGKNPACSQKITQSKVKRVVIGCLDSNPKVSGQSLKILKENNIAVELLNDEGAINLHRYFNFSVQNKMPFITAKLATSLDGEVALKNGVSKWLTNETSRNYVHLLRSHHDAILTGAGTVIADDPELNCRIKGFEKERQVIIYDSKLQIPITAKLVEKSKIKPVWVLAQKDVNPKHKKALEAKGVKIYEFEDIRNLKIILESLYKLGLTSIFLEAGNLITYFIKENLINELLLFRCDKIMGGDSKPMLGSLGLETIAETKRFQLKFSKVLYGGDIFEKYITKS